MKNSREIVTAIQINIRIRGTIFQIYTPISWKEFTFINTVKAQKNRMENRRRWRRWIKAIDQTIFMPVRFYTPIFKGYINLLETNPKIRQPFHFHEWVLHNHSNNLLLTLRKIADKDDRSHSVRRLVGNIYYHNKSLTKRSFFYKHKKGFLDVYDNIWKSICGDANFIPKGVVDNDLKKIDNLTGKATAAVNQTIAHISKDRKYRSFEFDDVYCDLHSLLKVFHKYSLLLRASVDDSLEAVIAYDWEKIFNTPWSLNQSVERDG